MFAVYCREFKMVTHDVGIILFFMFLPLAYPIIYSLIYNPELVKDVSMVVVDMTVPLFRASWCARWMPATRRMSSVMLQISAMRAVQLIPTRRMPYLRFLKALPAKWGGMRHQMP